MNCVIHPQYKMLKGNPDKGLCSSALCVIYQSVKIERDKDVGEPLNAALYLG